MRFTANAYFSAIAHCSLLSAVTQFNMALMGCLKMALAGSLNPDLKDLWQVSETTGHQAISTLSDLYQRISSANPIPRDWGLHENTGNSLVKKIKNRMSNPCSVDEAFSAADQLKCDLLSHGAFDKSYTFSIPFLTQPNTESLEYQTHRSMIEGPLTSSNTRDMNIRTRRNTRYNVLGRSPSTRPEFVDSANVLQNNLRALLSDGQHSQASS